ncbi:hypothetical protein [Nesterenkonia pannonica]|uniref:hypothetical protein n=1 Tax=Nesterenkonia pannonica TaxID=1548602 RepID=UPI0021641546|nr:hypothetical protein [Nesterenkonia pannonica]
MEQQVRVQQLIEDLDYDEPTDEEVEDAYDEAVAAQPEAEGGDDAETPEFDDVRAELEEQLVNERQNEAAQDHVEQLRDEADVETHL